MAVILQTTFSNAFSSIKMFAFYQYFAKLYSHGSSVLEKRNCKKMSTDARIFGAEVVERSGYLYTLFSVPHFSLLFWLSFKWFYR